MRKSIIALGVACLLLASSVPLPAAAQSSNGLLTLVVYPDGSVGASFSGVATTPSPTGTIPSILAQGSVETANGETTSSVNGTVTVPQSMMSQAPFNYSESLSATGTYSGGQSHGTVNVQAVSGVSSPLSSFTLTYQGTQSSLTVTGSATLQYGTYVYGGTTTDINATYVAELVAASTYVFSVPYLNNYLALLPYANLAVSTATLVPQYGTSSATINVNFAMTGNMTALPASFEAYAFCSSGQVSTAQCKAYFNTLYQSFASVQSYSYNAAYSSGILGFTMKSTTSQQAGVGDFLTTEAALGGSSSLTPSEEAFLNTTSISVNGFYFKLSERESSPGEATTNFQAGGVTVAPTVSIRNNSFNETGLFDFLANGNGQANVTIVGGANSAGSVSIQIPSGVPSASSTTANSATWTNVDFGELAPLQFSVGSSSSVSYQASSVALVNGGATADQTQQTGVSVQVSGLTGVNGSLTVITQQLKGPSQGVTAPNGVNPQYYDVFVAPPPGTAVPSGATARVCVADSTATSGTTLVYWSGASWVSAASVTAAGGSVCGTIPMSALAGTNVAAVTPSSSNTTTGGAPTTSSGGSTTSGSSSGGIPAFPYSALGVTVLTLAVLGAYFLMRRRPGPTAGPS